MGQLMLILATSKAGVLAIVIGQILDSETSVIDGSGCRNGIPSTRKTAQRRIC